MAVALVASPARAEPQPYELSYAAPAGCPTEREVVAEVRANVHDAASGDGARIALTIVQNGTELTGELVALDRSGKEGRRTIHGPTCSEVSQALAFLAALAIELGGRVEPDPAAEPAAASPPAPPPRAPKPAPASTQVSPPPPRSTWRFSGVLGAGLRGGLAPSVRPSAEVGLELADTLARVLAPAVRATAVGSVSRISHSAGTAELSLLAGRLEGCPVRFGSQVVAVRPCLGVELGAVFAHGDLAGGRSVVEPWGSSEASLRLEVGPFAPVFLELSAAAVVPFFHTHYFFVPQQIVYVVPAVTGRAGLAAGLRFQ